MPPPFGGSYRLPAIGALGSDQRVGLARAVVDPRIRLLVRERDEEALVLLDTLEPLAVDGGLIRRTEATDALDNNLTRITGGGRALGTLGFGDGLGTNEQDPEGGRASESSALRCRGLGLFVFHGREMVVAFMGRRSLFHRDSTR